MYRRPPLATALAGDRSAPSTIVCNAESVRRTKLVILTLALVAGGCSPAAPTDKEAPPSSPESLASVEPPAIPDLATTDLTVFMDRVTLSLLERDPEWMTELGLADRHDRLTPDDGAHHAVVVAIAGAALDEMASIDLDLDGDTAISHAIFDWWLRDIVAGRDFVLHDYPAGFITGVHVRVPGFLIDVHPLSSQEDAEDYLARLGELGNEVRSVRNLIREAEEAGILMPATTRAIVRRQLALSMREPADLERLIKVFAERTAGLPAIEASLVDEARRIVKEEVIPAYQLLRDTIDHMQVRSTDGVGNLPDGDAYYRWVLRHHTTVDISPEAMHVWGLSEVERIREDLDEALTAMGYDTVDLNLALSRAVADAGQFLLESETDRQAFLEINTRLVDEAYAAIDSMFSTLPSTPVVIRPASQMGGTDRGISYRGPDLSGTRPGIYHLPMAGGKTTAHDVTTTVVHGAVGHHVQRTRQTLSDHPLHQQAVVPSGNAEGWALYAERLAYEAGLYDDDPFGNIGRLHHELVRAAGVVTDTGIHALGWSRQEALDHHMALTGLNEQASADEVDRHIVQPGYAPGAMIAMRAILDARTDAQERLGDAFDLAAFHDVVIGHGSLPLPVLDQAVEDWLARLGS